MMHYVLSCCSTADLSKEHFQNRDIHYICFHYEMDGVQYADDLGESMPFDKFYKAMADGANTKTSQVNVDEFVAYFTGFLEQGLTSSMCACPRAFPGCITPPTPPRRCWRPSIPTGKFLCWIPWARPRATDCLWISWLTSGMRA